MLYIWYTISEIHKKVMRNMNFCIPTPSRAASCLWFVHVFKSVFHSILCLSNKEKDFCYGWCFFFMFAIIKHFIFHPQYPQKQPLYVLISFLSCFIFSCGLPISRKKFWQPLYLFFVKYRYRYRYMHKDRQSKV